jgi:hypothetical protein
MQDERALSAWLTALADLRPRFAALADADLHLLRIDVPLPGDTKAPDALRAHLHEKGLGGEPDDVLAPLKGKDKGPAALPPAKDWRGRRPIVWQSAGVYGICSNSGEAETTVLNRLVVYGNSGEHWPEFAKWAASGGRILLDNVEWRCDLRGRDSETRLTAWLLYLTDTASTPIKGGALGYRRLPNSIEHFFDRSVKIVLPDEGLPVLSAWLVDAVIEVYRRPTDNEAPPPLRLQAVPDANPPYLILDNRPIPASEIGVHFMAELIKANGRPVSFAAWLRQHPQFTGAIVTRVLDGLPAEVKPFVERPGKGGLPRLKVGLLRPAR